MIDTESQALEMGKVHAVMEDRVWLNGLRSSPKGSHFTYRKIRELLDARNGGKTPAESTMYRRATGPLPVLFGPRAKPEDIAGLGEFAIERLYPSSAWRPMKLEWKLRSATFGLVPPAKALLLIPEAEDVLDELDHKAENREECSVTRFVRISLGGQIPTYKAGAANIRPESKIRHYREAKRRLAECADERLFILRNCELHFIETILAVRMEALAYFAEYNLRNERHSDYEGMARRISQDSVLRAVTHVTQKLRDPRVPVNFAEAAGRMALIEGGAKAERYVRQAKDMVELTLRTANHTGPVSTFNPIYLPGYEMAKQGELRAAIDLINAEWKE